MLPQWILSLNGGPRRVNHSAVIIDHKIFMFGGYCLGEDYLDRRPIDVFVFNTYSNKWSRVFDSVNDGDSNIDEVPFMRYGHCSVAIGDNTYLWGGRNDVYKHCTDLFVFDTNTLKWRREVVEGDRPTARDGHAMCVVKGNIYMFGGYVDETDSFTNDMYMFEVKRKTWSRIEYQSYTMPSKRDFHTMICIGNFLYVFGGRSNESELFARDTEKYDDALHVFDTTINVWSEHKLSWPNKFMGRRSHSAFSYKNCLYIFGGFNSVIGMHFNDLWKYDPLNRTLVEIKPSGIPPVPRRRQCCCIHNDRVYIFGGTSPVKTYCNPIYAAPTEETLYDQDDLYVLDFCPSLQTLCLTYIQRNNISLSQIPGVVGWKLRGARCHISHSNSTSQQG